MSTEALVQLLCLRRDRALRVSGALQQREQTFSINARDKKEVQDLIRAIKIDCQIGGDKVVPVLALFNAAVQIGEYIENSQRAIQRLNLVLCNVLETSNAMLLVRKDFIIYQGAILALSQALDVFMASMGPVITSAATHLNTSLREAFTPEVRSLLETHLPAMLPNTDMPSYDQRSAVARLCNLSLEQVNRWLYNCRSRAKKRRLRSDSDAGSGSGNRILPPAAAATAHLATSHSESYSPGAGLNNVLSSSIDYSSSEDGFLDELAAFLATSMHHCKMAEEAAFHRYQCQ